MILVTGGTGTVGSRLVELLLGQGHEVRVFSRDADRARSMLDGRAEVAPGDLGSRSALSAALEGVERVLLLTPSSLDQLQHERNVIETAKAAGVRRVVKQSVDGADERSPVQLARWHREAEKELQASGLAHTILRSSAFMQNLPEMVHGGSIHSAAEDGRIPMVDAGDVAAVAARALTEDGHEGRTYTLTGPEAVSYDEAASRLSAAAGREIAHVRVPPDKLVEAMTAAGLPEWYAKDLVAFHRLFAAGRLGELSGDVAAVTGREARSLDAFAREELA